MQDIQLSFFRNLCQLHRSVPENDVGRDAPVELTEIAEDVVFREFAERPCLDSWWSVVLGLMRRLSLLPEGSLHLDILRDNIADARSH